VVKHCGTQSYNEKTHFCAWGDVIAPHCDDHVIYDPNVKFCSYVGNSQYNIPYYNTPDRSWDSPLFASTALTFCNVGGTIARYNVSGWNWEYCTEPTVGSFSVIRCGELQEPADRSLIDAAHPPVDISERSRCVCIANAEPLGVGQNGCKCKDGYKYYEGNATGLTKSENYTNNYINFVSRLSGGSCVPQ